MAINYWRFALSGDVGFEQGSPLLQRGPPVHKAPQLTDLLRTAVLSMINLGSCSTLCLSCLELERLIECLQELFVASQLWPPSAPLGAANRPMLLPLGGFGLG